MDNLYKTIDDFLKQTFNDYYALWGSDCSYYICLIDNQEDSKTTEKFVSLIRKKYPDFDYESFTTSIEEGTLLLTDNSDLTYEIEIIPYDSDILHINLIKEGNNNG